MRPVAGHLFEIGLKLRLVAIVGGSCRVLVLRGHHPVSEQLHCALKIFGGPFRLGTRSVGCSLIGFHSGLQGVDVRERLLNGCLHGALLGAYML